MVGFLLLFLHFAAHFLHCTVSVNSLPQSRFYFVLLSLLSVGGVKGLVRAGNTGQTLTQDEQS